MAKKLGDQYIFGPPT